jgi:hypothetical protein
MSFSRACHPMTKRWQGHQMRQSRVGEGCVPEIQPPQSAERRKLAKRFIRDLAVVQLQHVQVDHGSEERKLLIPDSCSVQRKLLLAIQPGNLIKNLNDRKMLRSGRPANDSPIFLSFNAFVCRADQSPRGQPHLGISFQRPKIPVNGARRRDRRANGRKATHEHRPNAGPRLPVRCSKCRPLPAR